MPAGTDAVTVHVSDDTFVAAAPARVAAVVADPARWPVWWPDLTVRPTRDRGPRGQQWQLAGRPSGTAEIWLEAWKDGTVLHFYLRLDPPPEGRSAAAAQAEAVRRTLDWKRHAYRLKDEVEAGRAPGMPAVGARL